MGKQTVTIKTDEENPEPIELIAQAIIDLSDAFKKIESSRLTKRAIILLIKDRCYVNMKDIEIILDIAPKLKDYYIKKLPNKG